MAKERPEARDSTPPDTVAEPPIETIRDRVLRIEREEREAQERESAVDAARVREEETRELEPVVRDVAVSEAGETTETEKPTHKIEVRAADDGEPVEGQEAKILIKNSVGEDVNILSIFPETAQQRPIQLVFGRKLEMEADVADVESGDPRRITIPVDFSSSDLPYLVREITRAIYDNETGIVRGWKKENGGQTADQTRQTVKGAIIHNELVTRQKKEEGLEKIRSKREGMDRCVLRKTYEDLEKAHSLASRSAERTVDGLVEEKIRVFNGAIGTDLFADYDGREGFRKQLELDTIIRQSDLVHQFDKDGNLVLLGRPAIDVKEIQPISALEFFTSAYAFKRLYHGPGWDIPIIEGRIGAAIRDSQTWKDYELLRKIYNVHKDSGPLENLDLVLRTFGNNFGYAYGGAVLLALELGLKPIRFGLKKARHGASQGLWNFEKLCVGLMIKGYKPKWKTQKEIDDEKEKKFEALVKRAMGAQA